MSLSEPELGLGIVTHIEDRIINLNYPLTDEQRRYAVQTAPLKRIVFEIGDDISSNDGMEFKVTDIIESESGLLVYMGEKEEDLLLECDLLDSLSSHRPEDKLLNNLADKNSLFQLRYKTHQYRSWLAGLSVKGFLGGKLSLIGHQLYLADKVTKRLQPRVLLADEVGLGKTIEAGLILHKLLLTGRAERVLIITPSSLNIQWFVEMLRKYNLVFSMVNEQTHFEPGTNPFDENNLVLTSIDFITQSDLAHKGALASHWDILVVDEVHKLSWKNSQPGYEYSMIEQLAVKSEGLLLLSATPEIHGSEGHFSHLKLIDPARFHNFQKYLEEEKTLKAIADKGRELISNLVSDSQNDQLSTLIDQHGPGRIFFRNTREVIDREHKLFPKRSLVEYQLDHNSKIDWLIEYLDKTKEKTLLLCKTRELVLELEKAISEKSVGNKVAIFHENLSLMARDKKAAYFADPEGANILLCSEIGSEGRNFQFCQNLIIFDLPSLPDLLEQRIGRLDRIGQKSEIFIHVPYQVNSQEEVYFRWYHEVFQSFTHSLKGRSKIHDKYKDYLNGITCEDTSLLDDILNQGREDFLALSQKFQEGRDVLIEINSFNREKAQSLIDQIKDIDQRTDLKEYLEDVYTSYGVDVEDLDDVSQYISPGDNMFTPHFPHLGADGFSYTFDRKASLLREEIPFMSWDHPMVVGIQDLIIGEETGNVTLSVRKNGKRGAFLEIFYLLESMAPKKLEIGRFLPPTTIRVLVDMKGSDFSEKWSKEKLDEVLTDAPNDIAKIVSKVPKSKLRSLLDSSKEIALISQNEILSESLKNAKVFYAKEIKRLQELQKVNTAIKDEEIEGLFHKKSCIEQYIAESSLKVDSLRFIY